MWWLEQPFNLKFSITAALFLHWLPWNDVRRTIAHLISVTSFKLNNISIILISNHIILFLQRNQHPNIAVLLFQSYLHSHHPMAFTDWCYPRFAFRKEMEELVRGIITNSVSSSNNNTNHANPASSAVAVVVPRTNNNNGTTRTSRPNSLLGPERESIAFQVNLVGAPPEVERLVENIKHVADQFLYHWKTFPIGE